MKSLSMGVFSIAYLKVYVQYNLVSERVESMTFTICLSTKAQCLFFDNSVFITIIAPVKLCGILEWAPPRNAVSILER